VTRRTLGWAWLAVLPLGLGLFPSAAAAQGGPAIETELTILATIPKRMSDAATIGFAVAFAFACATLLEGRLAVQKVDQRDWADYIFYGSPDFVLKETH